MSQLTIASTTIRRDDSGRYCLNDLHRAAGGEPRHQPRYWLANQQTQELVSEMGDSGNPLSVQRGGPDQGTFVAKELVYAYAMWISPAFHLQVIRAYDQMVAAPSTDPLALLSDPVALRGLLASYAGRVEELTPKADALDRIATARGSIPLREASKVLGIPERQFFPMLEQKRWIYRHPLGSTWLAYAGRLHSGCLEHKATTGAKPDGSEWVRTQVRVTAKGLTNLAKALSAPVALSTVTHH
ncbi:phage antirepressor KilAC domain-containing protein [Xanthomonas campestris pv. raphani]|uniref:phage antirepressor KilAC domain-containing protein n=1 Tax=Xanthomonas campestris TaxID=339 RepID=UPI002B22824A|nr:phage antirepressor KilAC domain-containing protein [Xanthomonas campestris]MEA9885994.1 phage antirepressor KilAC domain-containing protein [Xanthomonas campestris pv. raphani]